MGEYIVYYREKIVGGIYDNRFLVKPTKSAQEKMPDAPLVPPYEGAKLMLLVDNVDNRDFLKDLISAIYEELPEPKKKKMLLSKSFYHFPITTFIRANTTNAFPPQFFYMPLNCRR